MSGTLDSIYQELILRHYRSPAHRGDMDAPDAVVTMRNPTCGDDIVLQLRVKDGVIEIQGDQRDRLAAVLEEMGYRVRRVGG